MGRLVDRVGNRYGRLIVIEYRGNDKHNQSKWLCKCDCGNEVIISGANLHSGNSRSCGCLHKERFNDVCRLSTGEASFNALIGSIKRRAKRRNLEWSLNKEQVKKLTKQDCHYCGIEPQQIISQTGCNGPYIYNGLDRIDNSKGYIIDNVVPCCKFCNQAKSSMTIEQFREWLTRIYKHYIEKSD